MKIDLYNSECLEQMDKLIQDNIQVDAIITDPPYGTTACKWDSVIPFDLMWEQLNRIIKPNGAVVLFGSEPFSSALRMSNIKNYKYDWVWEKNRVTNFLNAKKQPLRSVEFISVFYKKQPTFNPIPFADRSYSHRSNKVSGKNETYGEHYVETSTAEKKVTSAKDVLVFDTVHPQSSEKVKHPTQKPIKLMEYLIKTYTNENETVLDFTMGSGTTGVACKNLNRNFIGIEQDDNYFNIAKDRIEETKNETQIQENKKSKLNEFFN